MGDDGGELDDCNSRAAPDNDTEDVEMETEGDGGGLMETEEALEGFCVDCKEQEAAMRSHFLCFFFVFPAGCEERSRLCGLESRIAVTAHLV